MNVKSQLTDAHDDIDNICLSINQRSDGARHVGFLFYSAVNDQVRFLHLAWHNDLRYEAPPEQDFVWLDIPFDEYNQLHFQVFLDTVYENNLDGIPYGISIDGINFDQDGSLLTEDKHAGLTCATFVMRTLQSQGYEIIDLSNWDSRVDDEDWQKEILVLLQKYAKYDDYLKYQEGQIGVPRFRPEEVTVSAASENWPLNSIMVREPSEELLKKLTEHNLKIM